MDLRHVWNVCIMFEEITRRRVHVTMEARGLKLVILLGLCMFCLQLFKVCVMCYKKCAFPKKCNHASFQFQSVCLFAGFLGNQLSKHLFSCCLICVCVCVCVSVTPAFSQSHNTRCSKVKANHIKNSSLFLPL